MTVETPLDVTLQWAEDFQFRECRGCHIEYHSRGLTFTGSGFDAPLNSLSVQRTLRGSSQARGRLSVIVKNHHATPLHVLYLETMPWHVQFYLHTMKIHVDGLRTGTA